MKIKAFVRRHAVSSYFVLAYLISWGGSLAVGGPKFFRGEEIMLTDTILMGILVIAGPCIAGITLTAIVDGRSGLRDLFSRMGKWRVGGRWYAAALLIPPVLIMAVLLALSALVSPDFAPNFLLMGILLGSMAGYVEEISRPVPMIKMRKP